MALAAVMTARLLRMPAGLRKNEGTTWCGAQTRAHSFPHLRILPAPLAPLLAISLALLCVSGLICRCRHGVKRREYLLGDLAHLSYVVAGGRLGSGDTFSLLNLVAGGQLDVGLHLVVHSDRLRLRDFAGLRRWAKTNASCPSPHHSLHSSAQLK